MAERIMGGHVVPANEQGQTDHRAGHQRDAQKGLQLGIGEVNPRGGAPPGQEVQAKVKSAKNHEKHRDPLQQGAIEMPEAGVVGREAAG